VLGYLKIPRNEEVDKATKEGATLALLGNVIYTLASLKRIAKANAKRVVL
jgi:hypothetical protein